MNKLSYRIQKALVDDGSYKEMKDVFYYVVDGRNLEYQNYLPLEYEEALETGYEDDPFEDKKMVILNHCTCGCWYCDCMAAAVTEKSATMLWQVHKQGDAEIKETYEFDKAEYYQVLADIKQAVLKRVGKGTFYHWEDGGTFVSPDTKKEAIVRYWKQQKEQSSPLAYFEDVETGKLYAVDETDEIVPYEINSEK